MEEKLIIRDKVEEEARKLLGERSNLCEDCEINMDKYQSQTNE